MRSLPACLIFLMCLVLAACAAQMPPSPPITAAPPPTTVPRNTAESTPPALTPPTGAPASLSGTIVIDGSRTHLGHLYQRGRAKIVLPLIQRQENVLRIDCPPDIGMIETDGPKLRQVLFNLLSNAAKFTEHGTVTLRVMQEVGGGRREASLLPPASCLLFEVIDTGIGIAAYQMDKLFQPFSQIDASVTRPFDGTGLALSRQLCHALGGDIAVESRIGHGSTFRVRLPASDIPYHISASIANEQGIL